MATPGFNFDVFISYRQNDNRVGSAGGAGWVSEFVANFTTELESMVKGGVSIYFDSNPKPGLPTSDPENPSTSAPLNSVVLVPVLSQTYCDPNSDTWTQEFVRFIHHSSTDSLGNSVKLHTGNVVSRVLPVCIHELDQDDQALLEEHLEGKLRTIPFVFKSAGVNRPLREQEDDPMKNINRTIYRDQVNKLAVAVKEILETVRRRDRSPAPPQEIKKNSLLEGMPAVPPPSIRSIAIFPLIFKSTHPEDEFLSQGFAEDLFGSLRHIRTLRLSIHGLSHVNGKVTASDNSPTATMILNGSMTVQNGNIAVQVQLVQAKSSEVAWHGEFQCSREELFHLRPQIVQKMCDALGVTLKEQERRMLAQPVSTSAKALELYWKGRYHWRKRGNDLISSLECFEKAADLDPNFAPAFAGIANAAVLLGFYEMIPFEEAIHKCRDAAMNALNIDPTIIEAYYTLAYVTLCYEWAWPDAEHNFAKVFEINPGSPAALQKYKLSLTQISCTFEEAETESPGSVPYFLQAYALLHKGKFEEGLQVAQIAARKDPNSFMAQRAMGLCYLGMGQKQEAIDTLTVAAQLSNRHPVVLFDLIGAYATMVSTTGAQEIVDEAMDRTNALPARINDFFFQPA